MGENTAERKGTAYLAQAAKRPVTRGPRRVLHLPFSSLLPPTLTTHFERIVSRSQPHTSQPQIPKNISVFTSPTNQHERVQLHRRPLLRRRRGRRPRPPAPNRRIPPRRGCRRSDRRLLLPHCPGMPGLEEGVDSVVVVVISGSRS